MKPRHAATLSLVGWYLMLPPLVQGPVTDRSCQQGWGPNASAPLSQWEMRGSFDTAKECADQNNQLYSDIQTLERKGLKDACVISVITTQADEAIWIATDDPRLNEK